MTIMKLKKWYSLLLSAVLSGIFTLSLFAQSEGETPIYIPLVLKPALQCPTTSTNSYGSGVVYQLDGDNPVRPAYNHADKNIELRGYTLNTDPTLVRDLVNYGSGDPTQPPQLATLFGPYRVPALLNFYRVHQWNWQPSPAPGFPGGPIEEYPVTALGVGISPGEALYTPVSGYDIGGGAEVIVIFADTDTIALHYSREDSVAAGYTLHVDNICIDPNLLALYNSLDNPNGPRYDYPSPSYQLPVLAAGQPFGTAVSGEIVIAIVDNGGFQDTRSCNDWWQIRPNTDC